MEQLQSKYTSITRNLLGSPGTTHHSEEHSVGMIQRAGVDGEAALIHDILKHGHDAGSLGEGWEERLRAAGGMRAAGVIPILLFARVLSHAPIPARHNHKGERMARRRVVWYGQGGYECSTFNKQSVAWLQAMQV